MTDQAPISQFGLQEKRFLFALHAYTETLLLCPNCRQDTLEKKFPLFILVRPAHPVVLGKTCRYCPACQMIMLSQTSLEADLAGLLRDQNPSLVQSDYVVVGTVGKKAWLKGMNESQNYEGILAELSDFVGYVDLHFAERFLSELKQDEK